MVVRGKGAGAAEALLRGIGEREGVGQGGETVAFYGFGAVGGRGGGGGGGGGGRGGGVLGVEE